MFRLGVRSPNLPFPWDQGPHLTQCFTGPHKCICQKTSKSIKRWNQGVRNVTDDTCVRNVQRTGFRRPGTYPKNPVGFLGYTHLKTPPPKHPHFYFNLILLYTLYATNNAIFYCFKAFKALSCWVCVLFYLFFLLVQKNPINPKTQ